MIKPLKFKRSWFKSKSLPKNKNLRNIAENFSTEDHFTAEEIYKELVMNNYDVGLATVYRVLTQFENVRIVVKHQSESNKSVYELNDPLNHDHMVCVIQVEQLNFMMKSIKNKQREIAAKHGYELLDQSIVLYKLKRLKNNNVKRQRSKESKSSKRFSTKRI